MALLAQRHRDWGCFLVLPPPTSNVALGDVKGAYSSPALKMRTSVDSSQAERASLESCCSASSAHGTARTEAQRLGLLACFATSILKHTLGGPCRAYSAALFQKCELLQIARRQKDLAWEVVAQPHLPMALLAQRQRDWGCLLVLPPQTSNVSLVFRAGGLQQPCSENANVCRKFAGRRGSLESCCSASSAHGTARTEAQRLGLLACLAPSKFRCIILGPCMCHPAALL